MAEAEKETKVTEPGEMKLAKPISYNGTTYNELHFNFDDLTGRDSMEVEAELIERKKGAVIVGALNNDYIIGIAVKACKEPIGFDAFLNMSLKDYNRVKEMARNFLLK